MQQRLLKAWVDKLNLDLAYGRITKHWQYPIVSSQTLMSSLQSAWHAFVPVHSETEVGQQKARFC